MEILPIACDSCKNRISLTTCLAFPKGIPDDIKVWGSPHNTPTTSQANKIVWEFAPGTEPEFEAWKEFVEA
jgi:hypothetical protein